jgi:glycosyltransferase involved in cell wall biosynthesis
VHVLHIVPSLFADDGVIGGGERYALELARYMAARTPTKLVTFAERGRTEHVGELKIRVIGRPWYVRGQRGNPVSPSLITEVLRAEVVHCHQQHILASSLAAFVSRLSGRRVFVSDLGGGGWDISAYLSTDSWYHGHLHISQYSRHCLGHESNPKAQVILGGVDVEKFSPDESVRRELTVLFVGRILPHKGINYLIEALPDGVGLEIMGLPYDQRFLDDLRRLAAGKRVTFRHGCGDDDLVAAYRRALCIVLPSVHRNMYGEETRVPELLGQTLLEGMACGAPALCTDVASLPEIVEEGVSGFLVPPNDSSMLSLRIRWLAQHPVEAAAIGRAGRRRVLEHFTWPQVVTRCLHAYESALQQPLRRLAVNDGPRS